MAAAARPYWTGFLKLSLVTIAVRLSPQARGGRPGMTILPLRLQRLSLLSPSQGQLGRVE